MSRNRRPVFRSLIHGESWIGCDLTKSEELYWKDHVVGLGTANSSCRIFLHVIERVQRDQSFLDGCNEFKLQPLVLLGKEGRLASWRSS